MRLGFVTLFPELIEAAMSHGVVGRAIATGIVSVATSNPRDFAEDVHKTVDDAPYGGGPGMLMLAPLVDAALQALQLAPDAAIVATDPAGRRFDQAAAQELANRSEVAFLCGRYEGIDDRLFQLRATHRYSIGDYVLSGGELPALVMADAVARLVPGTLGSAESLDIDSHADGLLSAPQFTRPAEWEGLSVPDELRHGNHVAADRWKRSQALRLTRELRPDLFALSLLEKGDADMLSF